MRGKGAVLVGLMALVANSVFHGRAQAQLPADRAVRAVVDSFFAAVEHEQWDAAATFIDLPRFEPFFKQQVSYARSALPQQPVTVEQMMSTDSTMPRAVAEWQVQQMAKYQRGGPAGDLSYEFARVTTQHELFALSVADAAARWIEAQDRRPQMREAMKRAGCSLSYMATYPFPVTKHEILSQGTSKDSTAYVVHSDDFFTRDVASLMATERVMVLHRSGGQWRIEARHDLLRPANVGMSFDFSRCLKPK